MDFIKDVKTYLDIKKRHGIYGSDKIQVSLERLIEISNHYSSPIDISRFDSEEYPYEFTINVDGVVVLSVANKTEIFACGFTEEDLARVGEYEG